MKFFTFSLLLVSLVFVTASSAAASSPRQSAAIKSGVSGSVHSAQDESVKMTSMKEVRSKAGLAEVPVNQDPELNSLLEKYLQAIDDLPAEGPSDEPDGLAYCGCYLYEKSTNGFNFVSPTQFAASQGAVGNYGAWSLGDADLDSMPELTAEPLLLDSRLSAVSGRRYQFADGSSAFMILGKLSTGSVKISVKNGALMDARKSVTLAFTSPADMTYFKIAIRSGGSWLQKYRGWRPQGFGSSYGFAGLKLNYFADSADTFDRVLLSWGARYRITAGSLSGEFQTAVPVNSNKSWVFKKSFSRAQRKIFLAAIRQMNPIYRAMLKQIAPYTSIAGHSQGSYSIASPYNFARGQEKVPFEVSFARSHMQMKKFRKEVIAHELAHILDFAGLDDNAHSVFLKKFKTSSKWRKCKPGGNPSGGISVWPCVDDGELIADQMAYSALNKRSGIGGYADPRLISSRSMMKLLKKYFHFTSPYEGHDLNDSEWDDIETPEEAARGEAESASISDYFPAK
jgi:hypothetical protein